MNIRYNVKNHLNYKDFIEKTSNDVKSLCNLLQVEYIKPIQQDTTEYLDYFMDIKSEFSRNLNRNIDWLEFEHYYNILFTNIYNKLSKTEDFNSIRSYSRKDLLVHLYICDRLKISPSDDLVYHFLKNIRYEEKEEIRAKINGSKELSEIEKEIAELTSSLGYDYQKVYHENI